VNAPRASLPDATGLPRAGPHASVIVQCDTWHTMFLADDVRWRSGCARRCDCVLEPAWYIRSLLDFLPSFCFMRDEVDG
jgi:hypothetical protein